MLDIADVMNITRDKTMKQWEDAGKFADAKNLKFYTNSKRERIATSNEVYIGHCRKHKVNSLVCCNAHGATLKGTWDKIKNLCNNYDWVFVTEVNTKEPERVKAEKGEDPMNATCAEESAFWYEET